MCYIATILLLASVHTQKDTGLRPVHSKCDTWVWLCVCVILQKADLETAKGALASRTQHTMTKRSINRMLVDYLFAAIFLCVCVSERVLRGKQTIKSFMFIDFFLFYHILCAGKFFIFFSFA